MSTAEKAVDELLKAGYTTDEIRSTLEEIIKRINTPMENEADDK